MKKFAWIFLGIILGIAFVVGFLWSGFVTDVMAKPVALGSVSSPTGTAPWTDEGQPAQPLQTQGDDESLQGGFASDMVGPSALATPVPGETLVYFVPSDNDATATVLFLYNTDTVDHTVALRGYSYNGTLVYSLNINIAAASFLRLSSDSIASAPPPSWATPAPIITNFTDFTYFASLSLPKGVKAEGYVLFNPGTGIVDPRVDQGAIPLRFSTDPATLFMPSIQSNP